MKNTAKIRPMIFRKVFTKLTVAFIFLGVLPLFFVSLVFQSQYSSSMEQVAEKYFTQIVNYYAKNLADLQDAADEALCYVYEYNNEDYRTLYDVILDQSLKPEMKEMYMKQMMKTVKLKCDSATSVRFSDYQGNRYAVFYEQGKSLRKSAKFSCQSFYGLSDSLRKMKVKAASPEGNYCQHSEDYVVTFVRNYMNTTDSVYPEQQVWGTICLDINVNRLDSMIDKLEVEDSKEIFILSKEQNQILFSNKKSSYAMYHPLSDEEMDHISGTAGNFVEGSNWVFYNQIGRSETYAVIVTNRDHVLRVYLHNNAYFLIVAGLIIFVLFAVYTMFSNRLSEPIRELTRAMTKVQNGDLKTRVEKKADDEFGYLTDGFNQMVEDLDYYIKKMYEAKLTQKEAELNALKMQIQPHYLYNTLDIIRMTALNHEDHETAQLLESLSGQLHYVMGYEEDRVELAKELNNVRNYFVILKTRYENLYTVNLDVANEDLELFVPKLLLQPMVENAVKHGFRQREGRGTVNISVIRHLDYLEITVMDNGVGMSQQKLDQVNANLAGEQDMEVSGGVFLGVGMKNVYDRIKMNCGEQYGFTVYSEENMGVMVRFKLPIWKEKE